MNATVKQTDYIKSLLKKERDTTKRIYGDECGIDTEFYFDLSYTFDGSYERGRLERQRRQHAIEDHFFLKADLEFSFTRHNITSEQASSLITVLKNYDGLRKVEAIVDAFQSIFPHSVAFALRVIEKAQTEQMSPDRLVMAIYAENEANWRQQNNV